MHDSFDPQSVDLLEAEKTKKRQRNIAAISVFAGLFLLTLFFITRFTPREYDITLQPKTSLLQTFKKIIFKNEPVLEGQAEDRVNILLLGMGGPGHDGPYLSDTNIVLSIKPSTKEVAMISVPRDLGVTIDKNIRKINYANAYGEMIQPGSGGEYARQVFENTFNLPIPYYVRVDFKAFTELVDQMGGVTINVPRAFTDTAFPGPNFSYRTIRFDAGPETMNGERALDFARSRHGNNGEGSDFARSERQQLALSALKDKLLSAGTYGNPLVIQQLLNSLSTHVTTNLNLGQLIYLGSLAKDVTVARNLTLDNASGGFLVSTTGDSGAFLLLPRTGDYADIQTTIYNVFVTGASASTTFVAVQPISPPVSPRSTTSVKYSSLKIEIQNGTWRAGLAARSRDRLREKGFSVITVGNSLMKPIDKTVIYLLNSSSSVEITKALSTELKAPLLTVIPEWLEEGYNNPITTEDETGMKYNQDADVLVILGSDTP